MIRIVFLAVTLLITVLACAIASPWNPAQMLLGGGGASTPTSTGPTLSTFDISRNSTSPPLTFANTNLTATSHLSYSTAFTTLFHNSGTFYFRFVLGSSCGASCGVGMATASQTNANYVGDSGNESFGIYNSGELWINGADTGRNTGVTMGANAVVDLVVNLDSQTVRMAVNGGALGSVISIGGLASYNLSPAWTADAGESATFVGGPPSAYGVIQWDGGAATQTPFAVSFNQGSPVSVIDTTTSGTTISGINVATSNGAAFAGTLSINSNGGSQSNTTFCPGNTALTNISSTSLPSNVRANCNFSAALDNASPTVTVAATENGTTVTGTLTMSVYNPGEAVACDVGPSVATGVPAPARRAGYTVCALNADFTQNVTVNGVNWTDPNTWATNCTSNPLPGNTYFFAATLVSQSRGLSPLPCDRVNVISDGGTTVYDHKMLATDFPYGGSDVGYVSMSWPSSEWGMMTFPTTSPGAPAGGPNGWGLPSQVYVEITFKMAGFSNLVGGSNMDFWQDQCNGCGGLPPGSGWAGPSTPPESEQDFWETHMDSFDGTTILIEGLGAVNVRIPVTDYHTHGWLSTYNGVDTISHCFYLDGQLQQACGLEDGNLHTVYGFGKNVAFWNAAASCYTSGQVCIQSGQFDIYIKSLRVWACPNYWNDNCITGLITNGAIETHTRFAWVRDTLDWARGRMMEAQVKVTQGLDWLGESLIGTAQAFDPFSEHYGGFWVCDDGRVGEQVSSCKPKEFKGEWWKSCLPGRDDCVESPTAFLGVEPNTVPLAPGVTYNHRAIRGQGYCYWRQPYTCSPDGKWMPPQ